MRRARILIAGCGDVGTELGRLLAGEGHQVWGLRRNAAALPEPLRPVSADLTDPATLQGLPEADYVVYTAAASQHDEDGYRRAYVEGLGNLLAAAAAWTMSPWRVFFTSSTAVYGQDGGEWVDEGSATEPRRFTGRLMLEAERLLPTSPFPSTVVRLAGIYGPGRLRLVHQVRDGQATLPPGPSYANRIHRDDCARVLAHLVALDLEGRALAPVYVGVDDEPADRRDVLRWLAERLGAEPPPASPKRQGAGKRCRNDRLLGTGFRLRYPSYRDGYEAVLRDIEKG